MSRYLAGALLLGAFAIVYLVFGSRAPQHTLLEPDATVLAVGDSLTYGYGAPKQASYPAVLAELTGLKVVNAGVNGETSAAGLRRLPELLKRYRPALTILCYGGNDVLQKSSKEALKRNIVAMIDMIRRSGSEVLLVAVPHLTLLGLEPLELYSEIAKEHDTVLVEDVLAEILEDPSLKSDHVHPNAKGYRLFAEAIYRRMQEAGWVIRGDGR